MALNSYFLQGSKNEQFLVQDLINEHLRIYGIERSKHQSLSFIDKLLQNQKNMFLTRINGL